MSSRSAGARGSVLAIDHGSKRSGFAVADPLRVSVEPLDPHRGAGDASELLDHVAALLAERAVECIVVGYPYNMDGSEGAGAASVRAFVTSLRERFSDVLVVEWDERLTTKEAEARLREAGHHGSARKARRDSWSAMVLLEDWIRSGEPRA